MSQICTCAVDSGVHFQMLHLRSAMEQQKTQRLSLSLKCPLSEYFQTVAVEEISQSKKPYVPDNT